VKREVPSRPVIRKVGTVDCDLVETTPLVFRGKLYRFEWVRTSYGPNRGGRDHLRILDVATGRATASFGWDCVFGCAIVEGDMAYAYGTAGVGGESIIVFSSKDLKRWTQEGVMRVPGWGLYNSSVCRGDGRFIMAFEVGEPPEIVGNRFTNFFAESDDLVRWRVLPHDEYVYSRDRYTACPVIRYVAPYYYMIYLEHLAPEWRFEPYIVRSTDLRDWQLSPLNPVLSVSDEDKLIANPHLDAQARARIAAAEDINNSDLDLCEFEGQTIIYYSWGSQKGTEFLAEARYDGPVAELLRGFFPE